MMPRFLRCAAPSKRFAVAVALAAGLGSGSILPAAPSNAAPSSPLFPPQSILDSAWTHLVLRVGAGFAARNITLDSTRCAFQPQTPTSEGGQGVPSWRVAYRLHVAARPWIDEPVTVTVDRAGRPISQFEESERERATLGVSGIGACADDSSLCEFPIDEAKARAIARNAGLEDGLATWRVTFHWRNADARFIWAITNVLRDNGPCDRSGRAILIDANTGAVYQVSEWNSIC